MNIAMNSYQINYSAKPATPALNKVSTDSDAKANTQPAEKNAGESVSISSSAQALYNLSSAAERQASMTPSQLNRLYTKGQNDVYEFGVMISSRNYNEKDLLPKTDDPERLSVAQQSIDFAIGLSYLPPKNVSNPFAGMARNDLSAMVYDDTNTNTNTYSEAERYAAYVELSKQDYEHFSKLFAKTEHNNDRRELYAGILEYFDALPPVEKAAYPEGHRDTMQGLLDKEVERWGPLALLQLAAEEAAEKETAETEAATERQFESILNQGQTTAEMLQAIIKQAQELPETKK